MEIKAPQQMTSLRQQPDPYYESAECPEVVFGAGRAALPQSAVPLSSRGQLPLDQVSHDIAARGNSPAAVSLPTEYSSAGAVLVVPEEEVTGKAHCRTTVYERYLPLFHPKAASDCCM